MHNNHHHHQFHARTESSQCVEIKPGATQDGAGTELHHARDETPDVTQDSVCSFLIREQILNGPSSSLFL